MKAKAGMIRAVTFDVGGTLMDPWPSVGQAYAEVAARFGIGGADPAALNREFRRAWRSRGPFDYSRAAWRELVNQTFASLSPGPPSNACFEAIYEHFAGARAWRVFDDVLPVLSGLKSRGFKCGLISNWDERLRRLLDELALTAWFDVIVISCEAGHAKPAPQIFHRAARQLGLPTGAILHVGDSGSEDLAGAQAAGMQAVLLDRRESQPGDAAISNLSRLAAVLEHGLARAASD